MNFWFLQIFNAIILFYFCNLGFPISYKTHGSTLIFQFQRVHILLDIILLISYFFHYHLIPNYKVRNPISNKNKRQ